MRKGSAVGVEVSPRDQIDEVAPTLGIVQQAGIARLERRARGVGHPIAGMIAMANDSTMVTTISQMNTFTQVFWLRILGPYRSTITSYRAMGRRPRLTRTAKLWSVSIDVA